MKIYTKKGDSGKTSLFGGSRVPKHHIRVSCYGTVDELNSNVGVLLAERIDKMSRSYLNHLQVLLFDIGSHLATDPAKEKSKQYLPQLEEGELTRIEVLIDEMQEQLEPLKHFIMPSGNRPIAQAHVCRTVCRRAERDVSHLAEVEEVHEMILPLLNRLSDYFFVLARWFAFQDGIEEIKWEPRNS